MIDFNLNNNNLKYIYQIMNIMRNHMNNENKF